MAVNGILAFFILLLVSIISMFGRCVFEMNEAQQLKKDVKLCPFIYKSPLRSGRLHEDVCIARINTLVDSKNVFCSNDSDKNDIHKAILSQSENGFELINAAVERIRLQYLLEYPFDTITGRDGYSKDRIHYIQRNGVKKLASSITIMVDRVHSLGDDEVPNFEDYYETLSKSSEPLDVYHEWQAIVESLIKAKESHHDNSLLC